MQKLWFLPNKEHCHPTTRCQIQEDLYLQQHTNTRFFIHIPCVLILSKSFYSPTDAQVNCLKIFKLTLKLTLKKIQLELF